MIALLSGFAYYRSIRGWSRRVTILSLGSFLGILLVLGLILVPRLLNYVASFKSDEMLLITVVGLCWNFPGHCDAGLRVALGAFLIGAIVERAVYRIETLCTPCGIFSAPYFCFHRPADRSGSPARYAFPILAITLVVVLGKVFSCALGSFLAATICTSLRVGMGPLMWLSFIIASLGLTLNVTGDFIYPIAVAVSSLTTLLTPYLIRVLTAWLNGFDRVAPKPLLQAIDAYSDQVGYP